MRKKLLARNTFSSLLNQVVAIICGFILPRLILETFGSEVNGLTHSITQFLQIIAFLELGVGAVVQSALYKPLADKNYTEISKILSSANCFFKKIATILLVYVVFLVISYPMIANQDFDFVFTATLILAMSLNSFAQYYFGIVNSLLLLADQHGYVNYNLQTVSIVVNTIICVILIKMNASIQVIKFTTSIIYLVRPFVLRVYVNRYYKICRKVKYIEEPIKQKWNGVAQHIAAIVLDGTDYIVLTIFATLWDVSIYAVYNLVIYGVKQLFMSMTNGIQALFGELWARDDHEKLIRVFELIEWMMHSSITFIFGCTSFLIIPFITVYTRGITDAEYYQPIFAAFITLATAAHCLRLPYNMIIKAAGHYKETQVNYIVAALLNLGVSIVVVKILGLVGVAIGTLVSMAYQTAWMVWYNSKNILKWPVRNVIKQITVDVSVVALSFLATRWIRLVKVNYVSWIIMAILIATITGTIWFILNYIFYGSNIKTIIREFKIRRTRV